MRVFTGLGNGGNFLIRTFGTAVSVTNPPRRIVSRETSRCDLLLAV
jgi:hypothetical protein